MLIKLMLGVLHFKKKPFQSMQDLFAHLSSGQNPETLFITCSDSRIVPSLITQANPGDLFVIRNIGNIIPPFPSLSSEAGALEYALKTFNIKDIIVCGHSQCGAMKGLLTPGIEEQLPTVASWLNHSKSVLKKMREDNIDLIQDLNLTLPMITQKNIVQQMEHLRTYPLIAEKIANNELTIHGWLYEFESGRVFTYQPNLNKFIAVEDALQSALEARKHKIITTVSMNYLAPLTHPQSAEDYQQLMQLFASLQDNILPIWKFIKKSVEQKLWAELGGFYESPLDKEFIDMMESGPQIILKDLKKFQKNVSESKGYHQYCNYLIRTSIFSKPKMPELSQEVSQLSFHL